MENKSSKNRYTVIGFSVIALVTITVSLVLPSIYVLDDDMTIQSILSGTYLRPYGYTYYLSGELGILLSFLYRLIPVIPWLGVFMVFVYILSVGSVLSKTLAIYEEKKATVFTVILCSIFIYLGFFVPGIMMLHYTVTAAVSAACGMFLLVISKEKKDLTCPVVLFLLTYLIRENVFFMSLPFIAVSFLVILINEKKDGFKRCKTHILIFGISFIILFLFNRILPPGEEWDVYKNYNDLRTDVYDYVNIWPNEEKAVSYYEQNGLDKDTVDFYSSYDIAVAALSNDNGYEALEKSEEILGIFAGYDSVKNDGISLYKRAKDAVYTYVFFMLEYETMRSYHIFLIGAYVLFTAVAFMTSNKKMLVIPVLLFGIRSFLWCYLAFAGRYPDRVLISTLIPEFMILISLTALMISKAKEWKYKNIVLVTATAVFLLIGITGFCDNVTYYKSERERITADDSLYLYFSENKDKTFIVDLYSAVNHSVYAIKDYDSSKENYMLGGGWLTGHPLMMEKTAGLNEEIYFAVKKEYENVPDIIESVTGLSFIPFDEVAERYLIYKIER